MPSKGFYTMGLESFSKPVDVTDRCQNCKGDDKTAEVCPKCNGTKQTTRKVIRLKYEAVDGFAEEDMTFKISDEWVHKGSGRVISASTFYLRCREFTGITDPDLIDAVIQNDRQRNSLLKTICEVTIIPNKTGKYLRVAGVERKGPILLIHGSRSGNGGLEPLAETVQRVRDSLGPANPMPLSIADVREVFLATGRSQTVFNAFAAVHGVPNVNASPKACKRLLDAISLLPGVAQPTLDQQMKRAGLDADEEVPF
jgi:hypothetical protein